MNYYRVKVIAKIILECNLTQFQQVVDLVLLPSNTLEFKIGVLEGSVLRFFLLVYISDLLLCIDLFNEIMSADHTTFFRDITETLDDKQILNAKYVKFRISNTQLNFLKCILQVIDPYQIIIIWIHIEYN